MLAFQKEIETVTQPYQYVQAEYKPLLPPGKLQQIALAHLPGKTAHSVSYGSNEKAAQVAFYSSSYYYIVYINPYSGSVLKVKNMNRDFFRIVIMGHYYLWLPPVIGQPVVASATLIFLIMLISGMILCWPKNKAARRQRFSVKWNAKWKRVNYDQHNVLGFYMTWIAIFIAVTGLVWGFQWFADTVYWTASGGQQLLLYKESYSDKMNMHDISAIPAVDIVWQKIKNENPSAQIIEIHYPANDSAAIEAVANPDAGTYWKSDIRYFDQYTLKEINVDHVYGLFSNASAADKIMRMNYDIHTGAVLGLPGKIMAFFASLIAASLPVSGFLIWRGRKKKNKIYNAHTANKLIADAV